jgi:peptidoglycan/xylan/chitin deacetylase (PgdA/CDA1 family)
MGLGRRQRMTWLIFVFAALALVAAGLWTAPRWIVPIIGANSPRCLYSVKTRDERIALTLDDGPDLESTRAIIGVLQRYDAHATFFLNSSNVAGAESIVTELTARGHELGNHMTRDEPSIRLSPYAFVADMREAGSTISHFGRIEWLRPGSAWYNRRMLDSIEADGYRCALASIYPYDAQHPFVRLTSAYLLSNARPGAVIALHERGPRGPRTVAALRRVLPELTSRGYRVVTLSELVHGRDR